MSLLFRIVYAAHANGTHHKLALDALRHLKGPAAEGWRRVFLEHVAVYLEGSKAPDTEFKDFTNHVLHVRDGYWGGAVDKVESWYGRLVGELKAGRWSAAVYAAGILSHYYSDPLHPFHTAQSEAENNIHRAVEWSISKSYDALRAAAEAREPVPLVEPGPGPGWLREMVCRGAEQSNWHYEALIAHYDIHRGVVDPPEGLDPLAQRLVGDLLVTTAHGIAVILDRAIAEAAVAPPEVDLTADTVLAALRMPLKWVLKKLADATERRTVEAMYDELMATGRVERTLPEDDRVVRDRFAAEVLNAQAERLGQWRARTIADDGRATRTTAAAGAALPPPARAGAGAAAPPAVAPPQPRETAEAAMARADETPVETADAAAIPRRNPSRLALADDVERAPSVGPRTAERLASAGVRTVADLLDADPDRIGTTLATRHITAAVVRDWQDQARLVLAIPGLTGTGAQLLVGAGYRSVVAIGQGDASEVSAAVLAFASSPAGQRLLREGAPPDVARIKSWCEAAHAALAA